MGTFVSQGRGVIQSLISASRTAFDAGAVFAGMCGYFAGLNMPSAARRSMLRLHCKTNGNFTESLGPFLRAVRPPRPLAAVSGLLGKLTADEQVSLAASLQHNGFHVFEQRLPETLVDEIAAFAASRP